MMRFLPLGPLRRLFRAAKREDGNATAEFAILFPLFLIMFLSIFEMAMLMTRYMMFERGVDIVVREMRLSSPANYDHDDMRNLICEKTLIVRNCYDELLLEMVRVDDDENAWVFPNANANCVDRQDPSSAVKKFTPGQQNDTMYLRACLVVEPMFPWAGLGATMSVDDSGGFNMIAQSAYSVEPAR